MKHVALALAIATGAMTLSAHSRSSTVPPPRAVVQLIVYADGRINFGGLGYQSFRDKEFERDLVRFRKDRPAGIVVVRTIKGVSYDKVAGVMTLLQKFGIKTGMSINYRPSK